MTTNVHIPGNTLYILAGIPGCGKSTFTQSMFDGMRVISSDQIRRDLFGGLLVAHTPEQREANNERVFGIYHDMIDTALSYGYGCVADATHLTAESRERLREIALRRSAACVLVLFTNLIQGLERNRKRPSDAFVPPQVMSDMIGKYWQTLKDLPNEEYTNVIKIASVD